MKKVLVSIIAIFTILLTCSVSIIAIFAMFSTFCEEFYLSVYKKNVHWTSDNDILEFSVEGLNEGYGYGTIKLDNEVIDIVVSFWSRGDGELYVWSKEALDEANEMQNMNLCLIMFSISPGREPRYGHELDILTLNTAVNGTGNSDYNQLEFNIYRSDLPVEQYDAKNHLGVTWTNTEYNIFLDSTLDSHFMRKIYGTLIQDEETKSIYLGFLDNQLFEVYIIEDDVETLVLSGSYTTQLKELNLVFEYNSIFDNITQLTLSSSTY